MEHKSTEIIINFAHEIDAGNKAMFLHMYEYITREKSGPASPNQGKQCSTQVDKNAGVL